MALIGPTYPFRGGIAHYTALLRDRLAETHAVQMISFAAGYPSLLFPGRTDRDPSSLRVGGQAEYLLAPLLPWTWWRTARRIAEFDPQVVIVQWWVPFWAPSIIATLTLLRRQRPDVLVIFDCHNVMPHDRAGMVARTLTRLALRLGDGFLVHSQQDAILAQQTVGDRPLRRTALPVHEIGEETGPAIGADIGHEIGAETGPAIASDPEPSPIAGPTGRILPTTAVAEPGFPNHLFEPPLPSEAKAVLFFGFVRPYKGLEDLIDALPAIVAAEPSAHLVVAGEFWMPVKAFIDRAAQLGVADRLHIADRYIANEQVAPIFRRARVCVLPYRQATQSGVITLAYRYRVPLVVTSVGGLPEAVPDGVAGRVVPPLRPGPLAEAVVGILADDEEHTRLQEGLAAQSGRFSWERHLAAIDSLLSELTTPGDSKAPHLASRDHS